MWKPYLISKWPPSNVKLPISIAVRERVKTVIGLILLLLAVMLNVTHIQNGRVPIIKCISMTII